MSNPAPGNPPPDSAERLFRNRVVFAVTTALAAVLLTLLIIHTAEILTLGFAAVLLAVCLSAPSELLATHARMPRVYALGIVLATLLALLVGIGFFMGHTIQTQAQDLTVSVPRALELLEADLRKGEPATAPSMESATGTAATAASAPAEPGTSHWLAEASAKAHALANELLNSTAFYQHAGGAVTTTFGVIGNIVVVIVIGLFLAVSPSMYMTGAVALVPVGKRPRAREILGRVGRTLQWWFVGQLLSMTVITILTFIGLLILGVPAALALAILAGLMTFVPNFGPFIAAIPAVLLALAPHGSQTVLNPHLALYVICLYIGVQVLDGTLITPTIQKRAVAIPPALIMLAQVTLAVLLGPLGLLLATPILAAVLVLVKSIYVEDVLGDHGTPAKQA